MPIHGINGGSLPSGFITLHGGWAKAPFGTVCRLAHIGRSPAILPSRRGETVSRLAHNQEIGGSTPPVRNHVEQDVIRSIHALLQKKVC